MPSPEQVLQRMDEILEESSIGETAPLDDIDPAARNYIDTIRRQAEADDEEF